MEEDSLPQRGIRVEHVDLNFPHYIQPRINESEERDIPKKVVTSLVVP